MALGKDPDIESLRDDASDLQALVAELRDAIMARSSLRGTAEHISVLYARTEYLRTEIEGTNRWVRRNVRAHNRHVFQGSSKGIAPGWARRTAQAKATWAKPRGWKP